MAGSGVRAESLAVGYGRRPVAEGVSLELPSGGLLGIVGPNGCGKTTVLRTVLGILPPLGGSVSREPGFRPGYVPQRDALDPVFPFRVREVVEMACEPAAWLPFSGGRSRRTRSLQCLERVGMEGEAESSFRDLSGGQRQRVLVARALASEPTFLALDEPTAGMDLAAAEEFYQLLRRLRESEGMTVALVSHSLERVHREATHALLFHRRGSRAGPVDEVLTVQVLEDLYGIAVHLPGGAER